MKNNLTDLNNYLFESLERLNDDDLTDEEFKKEVERSKQVNNVAKTIIGNARLVLDAKKHSDEYGYSARGREMPKLLDGETKDEK